MDAAQLTRKFFFCFAVALLLAGSASAANLAVSSSNIQFSIGNNQTNIDVTSGGTATNFAVTNLSASWFSVSPSTGSTPATLTVTRTRECGGAWGSCSASFDMVEPGNDGNKVTVAVSYNSSGGGGGTSGLTYTPNPVSIPVVAGSGGSTTVSVSTTSATTVPVTVTQSPTFGSWLSVFPANNSLVSGSPLTIFVSVSAVGYSNNQTLTGSISVTPTNGGAALNIPVSMVIGSGGQTGTLTPNPSAINLSYPSGTNNSLVFVSSNNAATTRFNAVAYSNTGWLTVNGGSSVSFVQTGSNILVSVNTSVAAFLGTGLYNGTITLSNSDNSGDITTIPVSLTVGGGGGGTVTGSIAPSSLSFTYEQGRGAPPCQQVLVPYTGTFSITPVGGPLFLYTSGAEITGPGTVLVCAAVSGLNPGSYQNSLNISSPSQGISQSVTANLTVYTGPVVVVSANSPTQSGNGVIGCFFLTGVRGCNDSTLNVSMSDGSNASVSVSTTASWITIDPVSGTTPATFNVHLNPANLSNGVNQATINVVSSSGLASTVNVPVVVQVNGGTGGSGNLTFSPSSLSFTSAATLTLDVSAASATTFTASSGCSWLTISPVQGSYTTPQRFNVSTSSAGLNPGGNYNCNLSFVANNSTQTVGVTFTVPTGPGGNVTVAPTSLTFTTTAGTSPVAQTISVSSASGNIPFTVSWQPVGGWLSVSPSSGTATSGGGTTLNVSVNAANLTTGAHSGFIYVTPNGGQTQQIQVTLTVAPPTAVSATPTSMTFDYIAGNANPAAQSISVTGTGNNLAFSANVTSGSEWLSVSPASGTAPGTVEVRVNPSSLNPGTYTGTVVVAGANGATGSTTTTVTLKVTAPLPTISRVTNAASFNTGPISAGEVITLFGVAMGPATLQTATAANNQFPTTLGGVQVLVSGYPAPLIYVRGDQISAVVPYEINRPFLANATIVVRYLNQSSNGVTVQQVGATPGIFTVGGGTGQGAILNGSNLTVNSAGNAAAKGEIVVFYVTGEGVTSPAGVTGRITPAVSPFPTPVSGMVTATIDGMPANVVFYGAAPGLIAGVMQVNVQVPAGVGSGSLPVVIKVGDAPSQIDSRGIGTVTVAVR